MKSYNAVGYAILALYALACIALAPPHIGPWLGLAIGGVYLAFGWYLAGTYLADVLHLGIAHRSVDYRPWFIKTVTWVNNLFGVYVDPTGWVNRHRLHHKYSDHDGDPNKLAGDGFWRTLWLCLFPYPTRETVATEAIFSSATFRITSSWWFALLATAFNVTLLAWLVGSWTFALAMWVGLRLFAIWVNMIQNYWTHTRSFGSRRYDDARDNAMNIGEWLPVTATFSACLQNNHHHHPSFVRLSHDDAEYDFGLKTVRFQQAIGVASPTARGRLIPPDVRLDRLGL